MNPYVAPHATLGNDTSHRVRNPAKPLLLLIGGLYALFAPMVFLSGLQAGFHLMVASALMFTVGSATIWLAFRDFTAFYRIATIAWGVCLSGSFVFLALTAFGSSDVGGRVFYGFVLLVVVPIPFIAFAGAPAGRVIVSSRDDLGTVPSEDN